ncbi:hypothetical protein DPEC_G00211040 [Dallia pectoralis]|uniref:Uncharacterized protein n=1 Tax=Dallia pectoralis TaxID=75939 RepID=A0ACC2G6C6_DALPE|nr:hypothetical protein DPEC_G00211040 [Dallia pectoralis]
MITDYRATPSATRPAGPGERPRRRERVIGEDGYLDSSKNPFCLHMPGTTLAESNINQRRFMRPRDPLLLRPPGLPPDFNVAALVILELPMPARWQSGHTAGGDVCANQAGSGTGQPLKRGAGLRSSLTHCFSTIHHSDLLVVSARPVAVAGLF